MAKMIEAVYENSVFKPPEKIELFALPTSYADRLQDPWRRSAVQNLASTSKMGGKQA